MYYLKNSFPERSVLQRIFWACPRHISLNHGCASSTSIRDWSSVLELLCSQASGDWHPKESIGDVCDFAVSSNSPSKVQGTCWPRIGYHSWAADIMSVFQFTVSLTILSVCSNLTYVTALFYNGFSLKLWIKRKTFWIILLTKIKLYFE